MAQTKSLIKEKVPDNVVGEIAAYLAKHCGIPGCIASIHLEDAREILTLIVNYNSKVKQETK